MDLGYRGQKPVFRSTIASLFASCFDQNTLLIDAEGEQSLPSQNMPFLGDIDYFKLVIKKQKTQEEPLTSLFTCLKEFK